MNIFTLFYKFYLKLYHFFNNKTKLYLTNGLIIVDKQYDLKINSNNKNEKTLQTLLRRRLPQYVSKNLYHEFYFVHRLDFATSGLMCIPLNQEVCQIVSRTIQDRKFKKYYLAIVRGFCPTIFMDITSPIGKDMRYKDVERMTTDLRYGKDLKKSKTMIAVLEKGTFDGYPACKLLIRPITGRRHQIRVHCSSVGNTIVGDYTYSNRKDVKPFRMFLHSLRLVIPKGIDVQTNDPFTEKLIYNWIPYFKFLTIKEGFQLLDDHYKITLM